MICPHCRIGFHENWKELGHVDDVEGRWFISHTKCPECKKETLILERLVAIPGHGEHISSQFIFRPKSTNRPPCPSEVPASIAEDYNEACLVIADSPKASAALSRRCLQHIIHETLKIKKRDLYTEIEEVIKTAGLPSHINNSLDSIRAVGKFAAHPLRSTTTGEIQPVEPGEAEWNLNTLESLFDFLYVQPEITRKKIEALNKKLVDSGKQPIK